MPATVTYATVNGQLICEDRGGVQTFYTSDTQGSLIQCRDATGAKVYEAWYWPYGEVRQAVYTKPKANPWGYIGLKGYLTDLQDLLYVRARYYRPSLARWQTLDPIWPRQPGYRYAGASPAQATDPSGLWSLEEIQCCFKKSLDGWIEGCLGGAAWPSVSCFICLGGAIWGCLSTPFCPIWFTGCGALCGAAFLACLVGSVAGAIAKILECLIHGDCAPVDGGYLPCAVACRIYGWNTPAHRECMQCCARNGESGVPAGIQARIGLAAA